MSDERNKSEDSDGSYIKTNDHEGVCDSDVEIVNSSSNDSAQSLWFSYLSR